jgi:hypothetical protein
MAFASRDTSFAPQLPARVSMRKSLKVRRRVPASQIRSWSDGCPARSSSTDITTHSAFILIESL